MNVLFYVLLFVIAFILGTVFMAFAYAWYVIMYDKVLVVDKSKNICHFMDRSDFIFQEIIEKAQ